MSMDTDPTRAGQQQENENSKDVKNHGRSEKTIIEGSNVNATSLLRLPPFWKANPNTWFQQVEIAFPLMKISADEIKFGYIVLNLDNEALPFVTDLITSPPSENKYEAIKRRIISSFNKT